jgi:hypothetical protein
MRLSRRGSWAAAAGAAALAGAPAGAARPGKGKVRLPTCSSAGGDEIIHKEDLLGKRGWQAEYSIVPGSPVPLLNQLTARTSTPSTCRSRCRQGLRGRRAAQGHRCGHRGAGRIVARPGPASARWRT